MAACNGFCPVPAAAANDGKGIAVGNGKKISSRCAGILIMNRSRYRKYTSLVRSLTAESLG